MIKRKKAVYLVDRRKLAQLVITTPIGEALPHPSSWAKTLNITENQAESDYWDLVRNGYASKGPKTYVWIVVKHPLIEASTEAGDDAYDLWLVTGDAGPEYKLVRSGSLPLRLQLIAKGIKCNE